MYKMPGVKTRPQWPPKNTRRGKERYRRKRQTMKKTTARGAYKKGIKKQMMLRRAPLVETKQRTASDVALLNGHVILEQPLNTAEPAANDWLTLGALQQPLNWRILPNDDAFTNVSLNSFLRMPTGFKDGQMLGESVTGKWLNTRLEFRFPQGEIFKKNTAIPTDLYRNMMIQANVKIYVIWGWVTAPTNFPIETTDGTHFPVIASEATQAQLDTYIVNQVKPYFDDDIDKLSFRPKETMNVKIEKYVRLKPNMANAIATQGTPTIHSSVTGWETQQHGSIPNVYRSHNFTINRKILYTEGKEVTPGPSDKDYENNYPNNSWLPFCIIYNPNFATMQNVVKQTPGTKDPPSRLHFDDDERRTQNCFFRFNNQFVYTDS